MNYVLAGYRLKNRVSSIVAPIWVAKNIGKLFLTPQRHEIKGWEKEAESKGERFNLTSDVSAIRWSPPSSSVEFVSSKNKVSDKQILLVHGWESRATQMYGLVKEIIKQGYTVIAVDMPGHGHSKGATSNAYLFSKTVELAQHKLGHFHAVIGHSMGAGATAIAVGNGVTTDKMILISGPFSIENVLRRFAGFVGLNKNATNKFVDVIGDKVGVQASDLDATKLLQQCEIPTLLIHDESDVEVPVSESKGIATVFKQVELFMTQGLGHRKILKSEAVLQKINGFVSASV